MDILKSLQVVHIIAKQPCSAQRWAFQIRCVQAVVCGLKHTKPKIPTCFKGPHDISDIHPNNRIFSAMTCRLDYHMQAFNVMIEFIQVHF